MKTPLSRDEFLARMGEWYVPEPNTGCWLWLKTVTRRYGSISVNGVSWRAHRLAYASMVGPIPRGFLIDHSCHTPLCVNPDHLGPATTYENSVVRGRTSITAVCARKTHCNRGHELSGDNLKFYRGWRVCRACVRIREWKRPQRFWGKNALAESSPPTKHAFGVSTAVDRLPPEPQEDPK